MILVSGKLFLICILGFMFIGCFALSVASFASVMICGVANLEKVDKFNEKHLVMVILLFHEDIAVFGRKSIIKGNHP